MQHLDLQYKGWGIAAIILGIILLVFSQAIGAAFLITGFITVHSSEKTEKEINSQYGNFGFCLLVLLAKVMKADEEMMKCELDVVKAIIRRQYSSEGKQKEALKQFQIILNNTNSIDIDRVYQTLNEFNINTKFELIKQLLWVAYADNNYQGSDSFGEMFVIHDIVNRLKILPSDYTKIYQSFMQEYRHKKSTNGDGKNNSSDFKYSILELLAEVMKADDKLMSCELDNVKASIRRYYKTETEQKEALKQFQYLLKNEESRKLSIICNSINKKLDFAAKSELIMELLAVVYADGQYSNDESDVMQAIVNCLKINKEQFKSIKAIFKKKMKDGGYNHNENDNDNDNENRSNNRGSSSSNSNSDSSRRTRLISSKERNSYEILGVDSNASDEEIKKVYRALAIQYHPDKVYSLGDEAIRQATETMKQINEAWNVVKESRGMK